MEQANNVEQYLKLLKRFEGYSEKYYRGQLEKYKNIPPSIARDTGYIAHESNIYYDSIKMKKEEFDLLLDPVERLAKLQHYGIPTRLVDVTIDPLYALYFAVENIDDLSHGKVLIYIAEGYEPESEQARVLSLLATLSELNLDNIILEYKRLYGISLSPQQTLAYISNPVFIKHSEKLKKYNERLHSQKGAFLICGNEIEQEEILSDLKSLDTISPSMVIRIPYEYKKLIKDELDLKYRINNVSIYPELPSVANYLKEKYKSENLSLDGKYSIVNIENISHALAKRVSVTIVLNANLRIEQIKAVAVEVINSYKSSQDVVWVYIAKTDEDYIVTNWVLRGQWINSNLNERFRPLPLKEKDENGYYWDYGKSYSTMADFYNEYIFDEDKSLFVYHHKIFEEFIPIYNELLKSFEEDCSSEFSKKNSFYQKEISRLYMVLQDFGRSRNKEFDDFLNNYTNVISPIDDIKYWLKNEKVSEKALKYQIKNSFNDAQKYIDIITYKYSYWKNCIGVSDLEYENIKPESRKKTEYQYTPTLPISDNAVDVYFNTKVAIAEDKTLHIEGDTNLFDKANLMLSLRGENHLCCQGKADVSCGKFSFPQFSNRGKGFETGQYHAVISLSLPSIQPKEFTELAGIEYENLTGEYVNRTGIGPTVSYKFDVNIE